MKKIISILLMSIFLMTSAFGAMAESEPSTVLSLNELKTFNGKDKKEIYLALDGVVFDATTLFKDGTWEGFSGGEDVSGKLEDKATALETLKKQPIVGKLKSVEVMRFNLFEGIKSIEKRPFEFEDYKGKNLIVSFWTTWCPYCVHEIPEFAKFKEEFGDDVEILMVHVPSNSKIEDAKKMLEEKKYLPALTLLEDDMTYASAFGVQGFPTNIIFDKDGYLVHVGYATNYDSLVNIFNENGLFSKK